METVGIENDQKNVTGCGWSSHVVMVVVVQYVLYSTYQYYSTVVQYIQHRAVYVVTPKK